MNSSYSFRIEGVLIVITVFVALILFAFPIFTSSCGARFSAHEDGGTNLGSDGVRPQTYGETLRGKPFDMSAVKAEIENAPAPENADETVWDALRKAFIIELDRELERRRANAADPNSYAAARKTAAAPKQDAGRVDDFHFDSSTGIVSWTYKNLGDYDLSGEVGVADITQIALNYGRTAEYGEDGKPAGDIETPEGLENHRLAWIDGDGNGEIGISDVTPIALNYLSDVVEYAVVSADSATAPDNEWIELFRIILPSDKTFPVRFEQMLPGGARNLVGVRAVGKDGSMGERSNLAAVITTVAPVIYAINVPSGVSGDVVLFGAVVTGTHPRFYEWNFGGGAEPNITNDPLPNVTLGAIGWYDGRLTVTNEYGTAIRDFKYYVPGQPLQPPVAIAQAWPLGGDAPLEVTFLCKNSYSPNGAIVKYEWDFESDGTYDWENDTPLNATHTYEGGLWKATLRVTDEAGQVGTAETGIFNVFPNEQWQIEEIPVSGVIQGSFEYPGVNRPAFAYTRQTTGPVMRYVGNKYKNASGIWLQQEYDVTQLPSTGTFGGSLLNGTMLFYNNSSGNEILLCKPDGDVDVLNVPAATFGSIRILDIAIGPLDSIYALQQVTNTTTGAISLWVSKYDDPNWTHDSIPIPNEAVAEIHAASDGRIAVCSKEDSLWVAIRVDGVWRNELVALADANAPFTVANLHELNGDFAIATYDEARNGRFYIRNGGDWIPEHLFHPQDGVRNINYSFSSSAFGQNAALAGSNRLTAGVVYIAVYDGTGWTKEALSGKQFRRVEPIRSHIRTSGELNIFFQSDAITGENVWYHAVRRIE